MGFGGRGPGVSAGPEPSTHRMAQLVLGTFFECSILPGEPKIVEINVSALDLRQGTNGINAPKSRAVIRGRIKNAVAVQHRLYGEPIDSPPARLPFQPPSAHP